jgi:hypothetical protein
LLAGNLEQAQPGTERNLFSQEIGGRKKKITMMMDSTL